MRKKIVLTLWMLVPVALLAYHYGPGQKQVARDKAADRLQAALTAERAEDWSAALEAYDQALAALPAEDVNARSQLRLARANARIYTGELPEAIGDLEGLLDDLTQAQAKPEKLRPVRGSLASAQYYASWLMRLEGAPTEEWTAEVEQARQNFRLLAEQSLAAGLKDSALENQKNLESTIRLARMDLSELQGLPLPKQCQGCKNCSQKCRKQRQSRSQKPAEEPKDARGAGAGERPPGTGS